MYSNIIEPNFTKFYLISWFYSFQKYVKNTLDVKQKKLDVKYTLDTQKLV